MNKLFAHFRSLLIALLLLASHMHVLNAAGAQIHVDDTCSLADVFRSAIQNQAFGGCEAGIDRDTIQLNRDLTVAGTLPTSYYHHGSRWQRSYHQRRG